MTTITDKQYDVNCNTIREWLDEVLPKGRPEASGTREDREAYQELSRLHTKQLIDLGKQFIQSFR